MSKQRVSGGATKDGNNISSKLLGANISDINIQKFRDLTQYKKEKYHLSGRLTMQILKTVSNKFCPEVIFTINLPNQAIGSLSALSECVNLMVVNLSKNCIDDLSSFRNLTKLRIADFSHNNIKEVKGLGSSKQMVNLHLEGNMIKSVEVMECLKGCIELRNLHLQQLSGDDENPLCGLKNYRENLLGSLPSLKRLDGVPKSMSEFSNGSEIQTGKKKELKIQLKSNGPFYTNKFPSMAQYQTPSFSGESALKSSLSSCKSEVQELELRVRALLTQKG